MRSIKNYVGTIRYQGLPKLRDKVCPKNNLANLLHEEVFSFKKIERNRQEKMTTLSKTCPICKHTWVVRHDRVLLGEIFLRTDFAIAMFNHLQSHTFKSISDGEREIPVGCYEYNKGVSVETQADHIR